MAVCECGVELSGRRRLCDTCKAAREATAAARPGGLQSSGRALWDSLGETVGTPGGAIALEACRTADRLDELDRVIAGKGVLNLMQFRLGLDFTADDERTVTVKVEVSGVLAEARGQGVALRGLLGSLQAKAATGGLGRGQVGPGKGPAATSSSGAKANRPPTALDQLNSQRRKREQRGGA